MNRKIYIVTGGGVACFIYVFYHSIPLALLAGIFLLKPAEKLYRRWQEKKRLETLRFQFKDLLYSISAAVAAGRQMSEALREGLDSMHVLYGEESPIAMELAVVVKRLFETREPEERVLLDFAEKTEIEDIRNFVDTYLTCRTTGGDVEKAVMKSANLIIEKIAVQKEIHTLTAQKKFEAKILTGMPIAMLVILQAVNPDYMEVMYTTLTGRFIMTVSLAGIGLAYYLNIKITNIEL